jgi:hypothetical protein
VQLQFEQLKKPGLYGIVSPDELMAVRAVIEVVSRERGRAVRALDILTGGQLVRHGFPRGVYGSGRQQR